MAETWGQKNENPDFPAPIFLPVASERSAMIQPLRNSHRRMFAVLGVLLPIAFVVGIAARQPVPTAAALPKELATPSDTFTMTGWERVNLFAKAPVAIHLLRSDTATKSFAVRLSSSSDFVKPDLLVYWVAGNPMIKDVLPDNAALLGSFNSSELPLPTGVTTNEGVLVLFSLADQEIVDVSKPTRFNDSTK